MLPMPPRAISPSSRMRPDSTPGWYEAGASFQGCTEAADIEPSSRCAPSNQGSAS